MTEMRPPRILVLLAATLLATLSACATTKPALKVIGVGQSKSSDPVLVVFVEVVNETPRQLDLSRLEYALAADTWFDSQGEVRLSRSVAPKGTAVVEIPVPFKPRTAGGGVAYRFDGRLFAQDAQVERSWKITSSGTLDARAVSVGTAGVRTRLAAEADADQ